MIKRENDKQEKIRAQNRARVAAHRERQKNQYDYELRVWVTKEEGDKLASYLERLRKKK